MPKGPKTKLVTLKPVPPHQSTAPGPLGPLGRLALSSVEVELVRSREPFKHPPPTEEPLALEPPPTPKLATPKLAHRPPAFGELGEPGALAALLADLELAREPVRSKLKPPMEVPLASLSTPSRPKPVILKPVPQSTVLGVLGMLGDFAARTAEVV